MSFVNTTPLPSTVFVVPTGTGVYPVCRLRNESAVTMFVGLSACTPNTGVPLPPNAAIELANANQSVYACSNWAKLAPRRPPLPMSAATAGTTSWTVASGGMANIPVGTYFLIGSGTGQEALAVATSASTTTITTTTASLFEHNASEVLHAVMTTPGVLRVQGGTGMPPVASAALPVASG